MDGTYIAVFMFFSGLILGGYNLRLSLKLKRESEESKVRFGLAVGWMAGLCSMSPIFFQQGRLITSISGILPSSVGEWIFWVIVSGFAFLMLFWCGITVIRKIRSTQLSHVKRTTFTTLVVTSVVSRRIFQICSFILVWMVLEFLGETSWVLFGLITLMIVDVCVVLYRQWGALYGDNELEFLEAVRYVIKAREAGRPPDKFDRIFREPRSVIRDAPEGALAPVRPTP